MMRHALADELNKRDRVVEQLHALQMDRDRECHDLKEDVKKKVDQMRVVEDKLGEVMSERDHLSSLHRDWELRIRELQADQLKQYEVCLLGFKKKLFVFRV